MSAAATLRVEDYFEHGGRAWLRLHEKGGKCHEVPWHHNLAANLDAWIDAARIAADKKGPLFPGHPEGNKLTENPMARVDVLAMIKRRAAAAALPYSTCCHTFRATGITTHLQNGRTLKAKALFVKPVQGVPIKAFPRPGAVMQRLIEECTASSIFSVAISMAPRISSCVDAERRLDRHLRSSRLDATSAAPYSQAPVDCS